MNILRPLSPHLPIYKPQLTSTFSISNRISGLFLAAIVLFFYLICLKMSLICFTYETFYQFFFYSSKLILISVEITALALSYHLYNGVRHLLTDFSEKKKRTLKFPCACAILLVVFFLGLFIGIKISFLMLGGGTDLLSKIGGVLASRAFSCFLVKLGCSSALAAAIGLAIRAPSIIDMASMMEEGTASRAARARVYPSFRVPQAQVGEPVHTWVLPTIWVPEGGETPHSRVLPTFRVPEGGANPAPPAPAGEIPAPANPPLDYDERRASLRIFLADLHEGEIPGDLLTLFCFVERELRSELIGAGYTKESVQTRWPAIRDLLFIKEGGGLIEEGRLQKCVAQLNAYEGSSSKHSKPFRQVVKKIGYLLEKR